MSVSAQDKARMDAPRDWSELADAHPFARFLGLRILLRDGQFDCLLPYNKMLIGNPVLPALHGGAVAGFMECAGMLFLLWHRDSEVLPQTINFSIDYLRSGRPEDTHARVLMVKHGQRVAHLSVEAWQSEPDKLIAVGRGNFLLNPATTQTNQS